MKNMNRNKRPLKPMTFRDFIHRFGSGSTSNIQLTKWAKELNIPNFRVLMKDEVKSLKTPVNGKPLNFIVNLDHSSNEGTDWNASFANGKDGFYFSSYALPPLKEVTEFYNWNPHITNRKYSTVKLQDFGQDYCGQAALYFLYRMNNAHDNKLTHFGKEEDFEDFAFDMRQEVELVR